MSDKKLYFLMVISSVFAGGNIALNIEHFNTHPFVSIVLMFLGIIPMFVILLMYPGKSK